MGLMEEMMDNKKPIDLILDGIKWVPILVQGGEEEDDVPYITHRGVLEIMGHKFECFQLSNGQRIFSEETLLKFFGVSDGLDEQKS